MKIDYDKEADALYIQFLNEPVSNTEEIESGVIVDYTQDSRVIGIEVLNISQKTEILRSVKELLNQNKALASAS